MRRDFENELESLKGHTFRLSKEDLDKLMEGGGYEYALTKEEILEDIISNVKESIEDLHDGMGMEIRINISPECLSIIKHKKTFGNPDDALGIKLEEWE